MRSHCSHDSLLHCVNPLSAGSSISMDELFNFASDPKFTRLRQTIASLVSALDTWGAFVSSQELAVLCQLSPYDVLMSVAVLHIIIQSLQARLVRLDIPIFCCFLQGACLPAYASLIIYDLIRA
jgi:hypothetical protein